MYCAAAGRLRLSFLEPEIDLEPIAPLVALPFHDDEVLERHRDEGSMGD